MKTIFFLFLLLNFYFIGNSQELMLQAGKAFGSFDYHNSSGEPLNNLSHSNENSMGVGFGIPLFKSAFEISTKAIYYGYSVRGSDTLLGNFYEWDTKFLSLNLDINFNFFKFNIFQYRKNGFAFYLKSGVSMDFLTSGTQNVNNKFTDLKGVEDFNKPVFYVKGGLGVDYFATKTVTIYSEFLYGKSFLIFGDYTNQEKLRYNYYNISLGVSFNLFLSKVIN